MYMQMEHVSLSPRFDLATDAKYTSIVLQYVGNENRRQFFVVRWRNSLTVHGAVVDSFEITALHLLLSYNNIYYYHALWQECSYELGDPMARNDVTAVVPVTT